MIRIKDAEINNRYCWCNFFKPAFKSFGGWFFYTDWKYACSKNYCWFQKCWVYKQVFRSRMPDSKK